MSATSTLLLLLTMYAAGITGCGSSKKMEPDLKVEKPAPPGPKEAVGAPNKPERKLQKITYNAKVRLTVGDFARAEDQLLELVKEHDGYVAGSEVRGHPGSPRTGEWTIRMPVDKFAALQKAVLKLGELEQAQSDSRDVTEDYHDLEARIKNKKVEEARLLQHLEKSAGKLEEILVMEKEISRVRGDIERDQGKLNLLAKLTELATLTVHFQERTGFVPPPPQAPGFGTTVGRTLAASWSALLGLVQGMVFFVAALAPWLIPGLVVGLMGRVAYGRVAKAVQARRSVPVAQVVEGK